MKKLPPKPLHSTPSKYDIDNLIYNDLVALIDNNGYLFAQYYRLGDGEGGELFRLIESIIGVEDVTK